MPLKREKSLSGKPRSRSWIPVIRIPISLALTPSMWPKSGLGKGSGKLAIGAVGFIRFSLPWYTQDARVRPSRPEQGSWKLPPHRRQPAPSPSTTPSCQATTPAWTSTSLCVSMPITQAISNMCPTASSSLLYPLLPRRRLRVPLLITWWAEKSLRTWGEEIGVRADYRVL